VVFSAASGGSHSNERIFGPQACYQLRKEFRIVGHQSRNLIGATDGSSIASFEESEDVLLFSGH
jgi:hypothetical protein